MDLLTRIDNMIDRRHLLTHPFYAKWVAGTLPREAMQDYARQYYAFESNFPRFLSGLHSRSDSPEIRCALLENLWDEEHGEANHQELWLRFAEGIGVARTEVRDAEWNDATRQLVATYERAAREAPVAAGVAAVYAYERQVPHVAQAKIDGLRAHYDIDGGPALTFFETHSTLDVAHSDAERRIVAGHGAGCEAEVLQATEDALEAWWGFLSAVDRD
jgi:pyrroloquinoline-quinone synthase